ncbi:MAG: hypothetical protein ACFFDI_01295 [Promethearchaeota archaeon]
MKFNLSTDDFKSFIRLACISGLFSGLQFILLTFIAMVFYPGGYDFFGYFISDLGRVIAINGEPNGISFILFNLTMLIGALTQIPFWLIIRRLFIESTIEKVLAALGTILGLISIFLLIGIDLFPVDTQPEAHVIFARFFYVFFPAAILIYSIAMVFNQDYSNYFAIIGFVVSFSFALFLLIIEPRGFSPFQQKITVYSAIIWMIIQAVYMWSLVGLRRSAT